jgi:hypothetical protein
MAKQSNNIWGAIVSFGIIGTYFIAGLVGGLANNARIATVEAKPPAPLPSTRRPK